MKVVILRGIPGSGKSTVAMRWLKEGPKRARINRDDLRMMAFGKEFGVDEVAITALEHSALNSLLSIGYDVIIDSCNVTFSYVRVFAKIAARYGAEVEIRLIDVDLDVAQGQNIGRYLAGGRKVPPEVITSMYENLQANKHLTLDEFDVVDKN